MDLCFSKHQDTTTGMVRIPPLPPIIGMDFQHKIGQTDFRKRQHLDWKDDERVVANKGSHPGFVQPPLYSQGDAPLLPPWLTFNKETLVFDAYFKEALQEFPGAPFLPRYVKIYFYLEDGTIQVTEPRTSNSGLVQGVFIQRQRIRLPGEARTDEFIDVIDLNIGQEVELYGRVFKITNCDRFTRNFLNRNGISVPDPIPAPEDPYLKNRKKSDQALPKKPKKVTSKFLQFMKYDRCVLRFYGYWDDRDNPDGDFHRIALLYYLADDTIEVKEEGSGKGSSTILSRQKLPMDGKLPNVGELEPYTVLNILSENDLDTRLIIDPLNCGGKHVQVYKPADLAIGAVINVLGRKVVLCDCDRYTKEYYQEHYGLDSFEPLPYPDDGVHEAEIVKENPPPYNGFGTYEDSLSNCYSVVPKRATKDVKKLLEEGRDGYNSHILRFRAKMITKNNRTAHRKFVLSYFLSDDTISIYEDLAYLAIPKCSGRMFFARDSFLKPGENKYGCKKPAMYSREDCYVGATLVLREFTFKLVEADEYTLRYMELNTSTFPRSNGDLIMKKIQLAAKPVYRQFVADSFGSALECGVIPFCTLRKALVELMGDDLVEHEILTVARKYRIKLEIGLDIWTVRHKIHCHFKKRFYVIEKEGIIRYFKHFDVDHTGRLPRERIFRCLKGAHVPLNDQWLQEVLDCIPPHEDGNIPYREVLDFMDFVSPVPCHPYPEKSSISAPLDDRIVVDLNAFLRDLGLEGGEGKENC